MNGINQSLTIRVPAVLSNTASYVQGLTVDMTGCNAVQFNVSISLGTVNTGVQVKVQTSDDSSVWNDITIRDTGTNATITASNQLQAVRKSQVETFAIGGNYSFIVHPVSAAYVTAAFLSNLSVTNGLVGCMARAFVI